MKAKTIKAAIRKKIDAWIATIENETLREQVAKNTIVTGGCIASMLLDEQVNDFDLYFRNRDTALKVANYYAERFRPANQKGIDCRIWVDDTNDERVRIVIKSAGIASEDGTAKPYEYFEAQPEGEATEYVESVIRDPGDAEDLREETQQAVIATADDGKPPFRPVFMSTNAITLSGKVQIVLRFFGEPDAIHENYDFVHCTCYWTSWDNHLELRPAALEALLTKELRYVGSRYPVCSIIRVRKFLRRGFSINAGQLLKMCMQVSALDLTDPVVLEDQLTGVDVAYFMEVIKAVKEQDQAKINCAYLVEIIDRMF